MKKLLLIIVMIQSIAVAFGQNSADRRGFKGIVVSSLKQEVRYVGDKETISDQSVITKIIFNGRTIVIGNDTYEIVKRTFDGETTSFTATKRRATYEIEYVAGTSIAIKDKANKAVITVYAKLKD